MRRIGEPFKNKAGDLVSPVVFIHPCWKPGCAAYAAHGFGVHLMKNQPGRWSCADHVKELETFLRDTASSTSDDGGANDARSNGPGPLFEG